MTNASKNATTKFSAAKNQLLRTTALTVAGLLTTTAAYAEPGAFEVPNSDASGLNWTAPNATPGVSFSQSLGNLTVHAQAVDQAFIDWNSFNIGKQATTEFQQKNAGSLAVNRVTGQDPTQIYGTLKANGRIVILDQNGVFFDGNAHIDVAGIVASTGTLDAANQAALMNGQPFTLTNIGANPNAKIENRGTINIADAGLLAFVAPYVSNSGTINAKLGKVALAAGEKVTIDLTGDGLITLAADSKLQKAYVENAGTINAAGGLITMTAGAAASAVDSIVNMNGVAQANSFSTHNGKIVLSSAGEVKVTGTASVDGANGAGTIDIKAENVCIAGTGTLSANATQNGNGGAVYVVAQNAAIINGSLSAKGGAEGGDGGFIETSGLNYLSTSGIRIDTTAGNGATGTWLIDPRDIIITGGDGDGHDNGGPALPTGQNGGWQNLGTGNSGEVPASEQSTNEAYRIYESEIENQSKTTNILIQAQRSITTEYGTSTDGIITLDTGKSLTIETINNKGNVGQIDLSNLAFETQGSGNIIVRASTAGGTDNAQGDITVGKLTAQGSGNITLSTDDGLVTIKNKLSSATGNITVTSGLQGIATGGLDLVLLAKDVTLNNNTATGAGSVDIDAAGLVTAKNITTTGGGIDIDAGSTVSLGALTAGGTGTVDVKTTSGNVTVASVATSGGYVSLEAEDDLTTNGAVTTSGGSVTLKSGMNDAGDEVIVKGVVNTGGGKFTATARGDVLIDATAPVTTGGGNVELTSTGARVFIDNDIITGGGSATFKAATSFVTDDTDAGANNLDQILTSGGDVSITANDIILGRTGTLSAGETVIDAGTGGITIDRTSNGHISLGSNSTASDLDLSQAEIGALKAGTLSVGGANTKTMSVNNVNTQGGISGTTTLIVGMEDGDQNDLEFSGTNAFNGLSGETNDDVRFNANAVVSSNGAVTFTTDTNNGTVGDFNMGAGSQLLSNGNDVTINTHAVNISGGLIDAAGGDITLNNDRVFTGSANALKTSGTGGITLNQWAGGSINNAVAALDNTGSGQNTLNVGAGTYNESVFVDQSNLKIDGAGIGASIVKPNSPGFKIVTDNVLLQDFTVDGASGADGYGIWIDQAAGVHVTSTSVVNTALDGIYAHNASGVTLFGNFVNNTGANGITAVGSAGALIAGNLVGTTGGAKNIHGDGIRVDQSNGAAIVSNVVTETESTAFDVGSGIHLTNSSGALIDGNTITNVDWDGIKLGSDNHAIVSNNTIDNTARVGIYAGNTVYSDFLKNTVSNNHLAGYGAISTDFGGNLSFIENDIDASAGHGIRVNGAGGVNTISGNEIDGVAQDGIRAEGVSALTVSGNSVGTHGGGIAGDGINVGNSANAIIIGNTVATALNGIVANGADGLDVSSNTLTGRDSVTGTGVNATGSSGVEIGAGNTISAYHTGVLVSGGTGNTVADNTVGNVRRGIRLEFMTDAAITGNTVSVQNNGIVAEGVTGLDILGNSVTGKNSNTGIGVKVMKSSDVKAGTNTVSSFGTGVAVSNGGSNVVVSNDISKVKTGIKFSSTANAEAIGNTIKTLGDGIVAGKSNFLEIYDNDIEGKNSNTGTGVKITNSSNVNVGGEDVYATVINYLDLGFIKIPVGTTKVKTADRDNRITSFGNGIVITGGDANNVVNNTIGNVHNGVQLSGSTSANVLDNDITGNSDIGIDIVSGSHGATVKGNAVDHFDIGVNVENSNGVTIEDNTLTQVEDGIVARFANGLRVLKNSLSGKDSSTGTGIGVQDSDDVVIGGWDVVSLLGFTLGDGNTVSGFRNGIHADDVSGLKIQGNRVAGGQYGTGIKVENSDGAEVGGFGSLLSFLKSNYVSGFRSGIVSANSDNATIAHNLVTDSYRDGITVTGSDDVAIEANAVLGAGNDGIHVASSKNVYVKYNDVKDSGDDGIEVINSRKATVEKNDIDDSWNNGVKVAKSDEVTVKGNAITDSHEDGVNVSGSKKVFVKHNDINRSGDDGVDIDGNLGGWFSFSDDDIYVAGNHIDNSGDNGVEVSDAWDLGIWGNDIDGSGDNGIQLDNVKKASVAGNLITDSSDDGVDIRSSRDVTVWDNGIYGSDENGVQIFASHDIDVLGNRIFGSNRGVDVGFSHGVLIDGNRIGHYGDAGVQVASSGDVTISGNRIIGNGAFPSAGPGDEASSESQKKESQDGTVGIRLGQAYDPFSGNWGDVNIVENVIKNNATGLQATAWNNHLINVDSNTFKNNFIGLHIASGLVDLTGTRTIEGGEGEDPAEIGNLFLGGHTAMLFDGLGSPEMQSQPYNAEAGFWERTGLSLAGNTLGSTVFEGQSDWYVYLQNGALFNPGTPTIIDGFDATYDGVSGGLMTLAQLMQIESMIHDFDDDTTLGQIFAGFTLNNIDDNDIFDDISGADFLKGKGSIMFVGNNRGGNLNDIEPAAGEGTNPEDIEPAAGDTNSVTCWSDAAGALAGGGSTVMDLDADPKSLIESQAACGSDDGTI